MSGNIFTIIFFVLLAGLLFATAILYAQNNPTTVEENRHNRILALTNDAIFLAIIVLMTFVPNIGYLSVFGGVNAPYIWLKTPNNLPSWEFFDKLLHEANVVGTPGAGFGPSGEGYFRLTAFGAREDTEKAIARIRVANICAY